MPIDPAVPPAYKPVVGKRWRKPGTRLFPIRCTMLRPNGKTAGITLFELVVVICVAALLAVLMTYSMKNLSVRTRVSRVKEEHRQLAASISRYQLDHNHIPSTMQGLEVLRRRTSSDLPKDPFRSGRQLNYAYVSLGDPSHGYLLVSAGPDGKFDIPDALLPFTWGMEAPASGGAPTGGAPRPHPIVLTEEDYDAFRAYLHSFQYDPMEEDVSGRDIITFIR